jgi:Fe-S cluster biogenesis protein NfuA
MSFKKIKKILKEDVAPVLAQDGGSLTLTSIDKEGDNIIVNVQFQGACIGCPHAMSGTLMSIEKYLQEELSTDKLFMRLR